MQRLAAPPPAGLLAAPAPEQDRYGLGPVKPHLRAMVNELGPRFGFTSIGGYRADAHDRNGHPAGNAADFMTNSRAQGDQLAAYLIANHRRYSIDYILWQQAIWKPDAPTWKPMRSRGSPTKDHYDHLHVQVTPTPGGVPGAPSADVTLPGGADGCCPGAGVSAPGGPGQPITASQAEYVRTIIGVGKSMGIPQRGWVVALATALQESGIRNLANDGSSPKISAAQRAEAVKSMRLPHDGVGRDHDSVGIFQQRVLNWGSTEQIMTPAYAAANFFGHPGSAGRGRGLVSINGWESLPITVAAQKVQVSAFPSAYADDQAQAEALAAQHASAPPVTVIPGLRGTPPRRGDTPIGGPSIAPRPGAVGTGGTGADTAVPADFCGAPTDPGAPGGPGGNRGWGGHQNGRIPPGALCEIPFAPGYRLRCDAVRALVALNVAFRAYSGHDFRVNSAYRTYEQQAALKLEKGKWAAPAGRSNHGWALACDCGIQGFAADYNWMRANAPRYGWHHPTGLRQGGRLPEPWHWEYGTPR